MIFDSLFVKALFGAGAVLLLLALWAAQKSNHPFDMRDILMDPATGKASLNAVTILMFAALSAWVLIDRENDGQEDVGSILSLVLGIFVGGRVIAQGISVYDKKNQDAATSKIEETTVRKETTVEDKRRVDYPG